MLEWCCPRCCPRVHRRTSDLGTSRRGAVNSICEARRRRTRVGGCGCGHYDCCCPGERACSGAPDDDSNAHRAVAQLMSRYAREQSLAGGPVLSVVGKPADPCGSVSAGGVVLARPSDVRADGAIGIKFPWYRRAAGRPLTITGRRLDSSAPPLSAEVPDGYHGTFQASAIVFPTERCWRVTGRVGGRSLTFVTAVIKVTGIRRNFSYG